MFFRFVLVFLVLALFFVFVSSITFAVRAGDTEIK